MRKHVNFGIGVAVLLGSMLLISGCPPQACDGEIYVNPQDLPKLAAPVQLLPEEGEVFEIFPRATSLTWEAVDGAASYDIEIDCFICCDPDDWCTDIGEPAYSSVTGLTSPQYDFEWVGAQPGRWRVRAVRSNGQEGDWTDWREFVYTI